ncbi:MAG: hypothetical protein ACXABK_01520 [Candidatus Heimdallarchaeaceae archaeon]|jgi:hypothetical protein
MSVDKEATMVNHLLSLLKKKNIWDLEIISSIVDIEPIALSDFLKTLPMAYGVSIYNKKISITHELVTDAEDEIRKSFVNWYQRTVPDGFSQKELVPKTILTDEQRKQIITDLESKVKVTVYGENFTVQKIVDGYLLKEGFQPTYKYEGGYEPLIFNKMIGNETIPCQFSIIDSRRDLQAHAPLFFDSADGFLFIFDPLDLFEIQKIRKMTNILISKRKKSLYVTFLAVLKNEESKNKIEDIVQSVTDIVGLLENIEVFRVSFAILAQMNEIERKINDLIQTYQLIGISE